MIARPSPRALRRLVLLPLLLPATVHAQSATPAAATDIIVTGHGLAETPATPAYDVQTLDQARLAGTASGRIEDALADVAGFQQFRRSDSRSSNPSAQGVTLRALGGNATSRALIVLDGVPLADPFFGMVPLSAIDPAQLASARITRGGGSGAFGAGAVAGTIELTSAGASDLDLAQGHILADQRGETELAASLAPRLGSGFAVLSGQWDRGEGFWTTPPSQRVPASVRAAYDSWSATARGVAPIAPGIELQARGLAYDDNRVLRFAGASTGASGQDASLRLVGRGAWSFDALGYVQARDFHAVTVSSTLFRPTLNQYRTPSTGWGGKFELRPPVGAAHVLRFGVDARVGTGRTQEYTQSPVTGAVTGRRQAGGRNGDVGLFAEDDWTLGALVLTAGGRADRWSIADGLFRQMTPAGVLTSQTHYADRAGWEGTWRAGAVLHAAPGLLLRAAAYTQFRQPTLNELYRPFTVVTVTTLANAALRNEHLHGVEAGIDWTPTPGLALAVTGFSDRLDDAIANVTLSATTKQRMNVDAIRARGVELTAHGAWRAIRLDGSLAWTDARVEASGLAAALDGKRPAQTPRLAASTTLGWRQGRWNAALTLRHTGAQFEDDLGVDTLPAATTLGAYAELPVTRALTLVLRGENLTDAQVITRNQGGSIDLGAPRTVWVGLRARLPR